MTIGYYIFVWVMMLSGAGVGYITGYRRGYRRGERRASEAALALHDLEKSMFGRPLGEIEDLKDE